MKANRQYSALVFIWFFQNTVYGQIKLESGDVFNLGTYNIIYANETISSDGEGENARWDYSKLSTWKKEQIILKKYDDSIPGLDAGIVQTSDGRINAYYTKNDDALFAITGNTEGGFQPLRILNFPTFYLQISRDSVQNISIYKGSELGFPNYDSIKVTTKISMNSKVDAWGKLILPRDSMESLRVRIHQLVRITRQGKIGNKPYEEVPNSKLVISSLYYHWYSPLHGLWVMYMQDGNTRFLNTGKTGSMAQEKKADMPLSIENPMTQSLNISNPSGLRYSIEIYNQQGKEMMAQEAGPHSNMQWNVENFRAGLYYARITNSDGRVEHRKLIKK